MAKKTAREDLQGVIQNIPTDKGVYLFRDGSAKVIYVGKAANLRSRVRSYFQAASHQWPKAWKLAEDTAHIEFIVTDSEVEALILEQNLIKRHRPRFNIRFKDDKRYPYIKVNWQDDFPKVEMVRRMKRDGARYFGPFASSDAMHRTMRTARRIFPYLTCDREITGNDERPCLYYHIKLCSAPCIGAISKEDYRKDIEGLSRFLAGDQDAVLEGLRAEMEVASQELEFERAARNRDRIRAIERASQDQRAVFNSRVDQDVIALARRNGEACAQVFFVRGGRLINRESFILEGTENEAEREVLTSFLKQFYDGVAYVPSEVLLSDAVADEALIREWLETRRGSKVALSVPKRGKKRSLVKMAAENAALTLAHVEARDQAEEAKALDALAELQGALTLEEAPSRIEAFDISNIQGRLATGSMVVFTDGRPDTDGYRRFKIRTVDGADDYAMMREVLRRRFAHALTEGEEGHDTSEWTHLPDLVLIDGGAGQLGAALEVLEEQGLYTIPTVALAKTEEEIYVPGRRETIRLEPGSGALHLVQRVRDEAHRFALGYHRTLRRKAGVASVLDDIPGVGPRRKKALLRQFGSVRAIRAASLEELSSVKGMNEAVAQRVKDLL